MTPVVVAYLDTAWHELTPAIQYTAFEVLEQGASLPFTLATWKPDGTETPEQREWFRKAQTTPEAKARLGWSSCCDNADRYRTTHQSWQYDRKPRGADRRSPEMAHISIHRFAAGNGEECRSKYRKSP